MEAPFFQYDIRTQDFILEKVDTHIKGRLLESILITFFTKHQELQSNYGVTTHRNELTGRECDIVIYDRNTYESTAIEVKHSSAPDLRQAKHLLDASYMREVGNVIGGPVVKKMVVYMGLTGVLQTDKERIAYLNAEQAMQEWEQILPQMPLPLQTLHLDRSSQTMDQVQQSINAVDQIKQTCMRRIEDNAHQAPHFKEEPEEWKDDPG